MRYLVFATDYDGTLAHDGMVSPETVNALEQLRQSGRKLVLVTGRELPDLEAVFPKLQLFERVVAENGALLYSPGSKAKRALGERPPEKFIESLRQSGVPNLSTGEVILATWRPHEQQVINAIRDFGLELQVIFNKDAVMILPSGINKMTGLSAALKEMKISRHNVAGIGDAENDHAFLSCCECAVAVANAIPALAEKADLVTEGARGEGVAELAQRLIDSDLSDLAPRLDRHNIALGSAEGRPIGIYPFGRIILVCGESSSGKSTLVAGLVERVAAKGYQVCLVDPEGDYREAEGLLATGDTGHAPSLDHLQKMLDDPDAQLTINMVGVRIEDRPEFFERALVFIQENRLRTGRPHWLIIDEAHHMFSSERPPTPIELTGQVGNIVLVTVHPEHVSPAALKAVNTVIAVGRNADNLIRQFCRVADLKPPEIPTDNPAAGEAFVWLTDSNQPIARVQTEPPRGERGRHKRKYAEGKIEDDRVFHFRGPEDKLNLRAQNLTIFMQIAEGVDDATWLFHLRRGDYSKWMRDQIKDAATADQIEAVEQDKSLSPQDSRSRIGKVIEEKYTSPV